MVERLVITAKMNEISVTDLPERIRKQKPAEERLVKMLEGESMTQMLWRIEKELLEEAYRIHGNTRKTANALGITQSLLMRRFKRYGIRRLTE